MLAAPEVGQIVRVLPPFAESFPDTYEIVEVINNDDGQIACAIAGDGAFDPKYVEAVE